MRMPKGRPIRGILESSGLRIEKLVNGMEKLHFIVSDKILLVDRTKAVSSLEELTKWPPIFEKTWARTGGIKVVRLGVVETMFEESRNRLLRMVGHKDQKMHAHAAFCIFKVDFDIFSGCHSIHESLVLQNDFIADLNGLGRGWNSTVDEVGKEEESGRRRCIQASGVSTDCPRKWSTKGEVVEATWNRRIGRPCHILWPHGLESGKPNRNKDTGFESVGAFPRLSILEEGMQG